MKSSVDISVVYTECHNHLREAAKKRDTLIGFFAVVLGLVAKDFEKASPLLREIIAVAVTACGLLTLIAIVHLIRWHKTYVRCLKFLQTDFGGASCSSISRAVKLTDYLPFKSTEMTMLNIAAILVFIPFQILIQNFELSFLKLPGVIGSMGIIGNLLLFVVLVNFLAIRSLLKNERRPLSEIWIVSGFARTVDSK